MMIRPTLAADVAALTAIYGHHVRHGTGTFETEAPSEADMQSRWQSVIGLGMPHLVLTRQDQVLGFAYAQPFRPRQAYRYCLEDSIYLAPGVLGQGLGRILLAELIARAVRLGARQMVAVIGDSENQASIGLHRCLGFEHAGRLHASGWKQGRWLDAVFMQRRLGAGDESPPGP
jgi:phosphinothricin acetyltransferase